MLILPIIFTFLLASFPAGLVIYWAWNNLLSIAQQWVIMKRIRRVRGSAGRRLSRPQNDAMQQDRCRTGRGAAAVRPASAASSPASPALGQLPPSGLPEIAFAGRSNVGKSSLINALTGRGRSGAHLEHAGPHAADQLLRSRPAA